MGLLWLLGFLSAFREGLRGGSREAAQRVRGSGEASGPECREKRTATYFAHCPPSVTVGN